MVEIILPEEKSFRCQLQLVDCEDKQKSIDSLREKSTMEHLM